MNERTGWYGVDLDCTLAKYDGWVGADVIGEPIPLMVARVKQWLAEGKQVKIFTARVYHDNNTALLIRARQARIAIEAWCKKHIGVVLPVTNVKDLDMIELWDDRAVRVIPNTGICVEEISV